jgi:hypothetical protein
MSIHCYQWGTDLFKLLIGILFNLARSYIFSVPNCGRFDNITYCVCHISRNNEYLFKTYILIKLHVVIFFFVTDLMSLIIQ